MTPKKLAESHKWRLRLRSRGTRLPEAIVAVLVAMLFAGTLVVAVAQRNRAPTDAHPAKPTSATIQTPPVLPSKPPTPPPTATTPPTPWATPAVISYVSASNVAFSDPTNGWALGDGCDAQGQCEVSVARTGNGGATWSLISPPIDPRQGSGYLAISAASATDAWIWGADAAGAGVLAATHDAGHTWTRQLLGKEVIISLAIAHGTAWAAVSCALDTLGPCATHLLSDATTGGGWNQIGGDLPVAGPLQQGPGAPLGQLVRTGSRAWFVISNQQAPAIVRSDDDGQSWQGLATPCKNPDLLAASSEQNLLLVCAFNGGNGGSQKAIWASADGGSQWLLRSSVDFTYSGAGPTVGRLFLPGFPVSFDAIDSRTAWIAAELEDDWVTHDGGVTWSPAALPPLPFSNAVGGSEVTFVDAVHGWTTSASGELWHTDDGGVTWHYQPIIGPVPAN